MLENYTTTEDGIIQQTSIVNNLQVYDVEYVNNRYNSYGELGMQMAYYRLGFLLGQLNRVPNSVLDIGYGNGDFLKACTNIIPNCYGNDVSNYPLPSGVTFVDNIFEQEYDVITFFDVLEHFKDITFIKDLQCKHILISLPWCHYFSEEWFSTWKHRRPDEHLWHFNESALVSFFDRMGYDNLVISNMEDAIRNDVNAKKYNYSNILTGFFKKR